MGLPALSKKSTSDTRSPHKNRPNHFPITPFLKQPTSFIPSQQASHLLAPKMTTDVPENRQSTWHKDSSDRRSHSQPATSIYDAFSRSSIDTRTSTREPVIEIDDNSNRRHRDLLSPALSERHRALSRSSSIDGLSNPPSIYSPASTMTDLNDLTELNLRFPRTPTDLGYETSSTAHHGGRRHRSNVRAQMMNAEVLEEHADEDKVSAHHLNTVRGRNRSVNSVASKVKADKMLGLVAPDTSLVSAYMCSGLGLVSHYVNYKP